tara:strand:- start:2 stop:682 length:681 start_codon:yes stop_codon:yes gene_type:complete
MTKLWINDIKELFNKNHILEVLPKSNYDKNRKLNALFRFSLYYSIIIYLIYNKNSVIYFPIIIGIITIVFGNIHNKLNNNKENELKELYSNLNTFNSYNDNNTQNKSKCKQTDENNPFMNLNWTNINNNPNEACYSYDNLETQGNIEGNFNKGLIHGFDDILNNNNSQNRYYTVPNTMPSNKQDVLGEWCYGSPDTCKEGNGLQCANNLHNRLNRHSGENNNNSAS